MWTESILHGIRARLGNTFILHGSPGDLVPTPESPARYVSLTQFLRECVFDGRHAVIEYNRADGPVFHSRQSHAAFAAKVSVYDSVHGTNFAQTLPRDPATFLPLLDSFLKHAVMGDDRISVAIILPYAETLIPESSGGSMSPEDRVARVFLQKWSTDPGLLAADITFVLITENLADIDARMVRSPQTVEIEIPRPNEDERLRFIRALRPDAWFKASSDLSADQLADE